jgi:hypothetical protein
MSFPVAEHLMQGIRGVVIYPSISYYPPLCTIRRLSPRAVGFILPRAFVDFRKGNLLHPILPIPIPTLAFSRAKVVE